MVKAGVKKIKGVTQEVISVTYEKTLFQLIDLQ